MGLMQQGKFSHYTSFLFKGLLFGSIPCLLAAGFAYSNSHNMSDWSITPQSMNTPNNQLSKLLQKSFTLDRLEISGVRSIKIEYVDKYTNPLLGQQMTFNDLKKVIQAVGDAYEARGKKRPYVSIPLNSVHDNGIKVEVADNATTYKNKQHRFGASTVSTTRKSAFKFRRKETIDLVQINGVKQIQRKDIKPVAYSTFATGKLSLRDTHKKMYEVVNAYEDKRLYAPRVVVPLDNRKSNTLAFNISEYEKIN